jgi:hypothetical protein
MLVVLEAISGPITGRRIEVRAGTILRVGRTTRSDYAIGEDSYLSSLHFSVECDGTQCRVRDMGSSNGTFVNGSRITDLVVKEGDSVAAGESAFAVHLEALAAATAPVDTGRGNTATAPMFLRPPEPMLGTSANRTVPVLIPGGLPGGPGSLAVAPWAGFTRGQSILLNTLYQSAGAVYAVLDASRDSRIPAFLDASGEQFRPLDPATRSAVFVVAPAPQGRLLDVLIKDGWGHGWGFFCIAAVPIDEACAHWRNYATLFTRAGRPFTFRFWDPRVLRALAPALPVEEATEFFGPVTRIVVEGEKPEMGLDLTLTPRGPRQQTLLLV